jgi:DNA-binding NtrC family response regulator
MAGQRGRVLIIEDEAPLRNILRRVLSSEHEVITLARAQDALDRITAGERFDLILCNLTLPGVTGMDFHRHVSQIAPELVNRTVFTSGGAHTDEAVAFIKRSDIRHIEKPFPPIDVLRATVRELLDLVVRSRS